MSSHFSKIEENLYLGSLRARRDSLFLKEAGIEVIVAALTSMERDTYCSWIEGIEDYDITLDDHDGNSTPLCSD